MPAFDRAVASLPGKERFGQTPFGAPVVVHVLAGETGGTLGAWDTVTPPGGGPKGHTHTREVETFLVLEITFHFVCGDDEFDAPPGTVVALPSHVPHKWWNIGAGPGRTMAIVAPGGCEQLFIDLAIDRTRDPAAVTRSEARVGLITDEVKALGLVENADSTMAPFPGAVVSRPETARKTANAEAALAFFIWVPPIRAGR